MCDRWAGEFDRDYAAARARGEDQLDPAVARAGIELFRQLPGTVQRPALLCTDLHHDNVLAAAREPWLAIDPKPYVGDPAYDTLQHMLNFPGRLAADPAGLARRMAGLLDLDADRVRLWLFARCVQESVCEPNLRTGADGAAEIGTHHQASGLFQEGVAAAIMERLGVQATAVRWAGSELFHGGGLPGDVPPPESAEAREALWLAARLARRAGLSHVGT